MSGLEGLLTGRTLVNRYRIEAVIGRGGFAAVYRASDQRLDRTVAVKVITLAASDEETRKHLRERFQREARSAASLPQHPNVITVHDFGTDPDLGLDFLVMEFLHGEDLATHLARQRKLSLDSALGVLRDAVEGVAVGHRENLIHRDVKPGNIFLAEPHGTDPFRVCVLDFGIAHVMTKDQTVTRLTQGGVPLSPAYASPEQLRGDRNLTCASDVFSLGVVAYQLLTGEKPLRADRSTDPADWRPEKGVRELSPEVPAAVEAVVRKAMSFAPEERYQDAGEMARALDSAASGAPPVAPVAAVPGAAAPIFAGAAIGADDEHTLLHPEPAPDPISPRPAAHAAVAEPAGGGSPFGKLWVIGLIAAVLTLGGLWALTRGGQPDQPSNSGEIILDGSGDERDRAPRSETPRVTGEIIEDPRLDQNGGMTTQPSAGGAPIYTDPLPPSQPNGGTIIMPPQQPGQQQPAPQPGQQQPTPQPGQQQPAPQPGQQQPTPPPGQPQPGQQQPSPQPQPQQPAPQQPEGPPLLGVPATPTPAAPDTSAPGA